MQMFCTKRVLLIITLFSFSLGFAQTIPILPAAGPLTPPQQTGILALIAAAPEGSTIIFQGASYGPFLAPIVVPAARISFVSAVNSTTIFSATPAGPVLAVPPGANFSCTGIDFEYDNTGPSRNVNVAEVGGVGLATNISSDNCSFSGGIRNLIAAEPAGNGLLIEGNVTGTIVNSQFINNGGNGIEVGPSVVA
ncbi:MAG: hypothetical protein AAF267_13285, partial [Deinococcota bacterium]